MLGERVNPMVDAAGGGAVAAHGAALAAERARALGAFLRARRESLDPARLGLPRAGRRRTPGLRREEVAALADVGVTWYTWLEQGRPVRASARVLTAIAGALQCSDVETGHVLALAGLGDAAPRLQPLCEPLTDTGRMLLDQLGPWPAMLQSPRFDILGANPAFERLMGVTLADLPEADRNCVYQAFTNPHWRARLADRDNVLQHMVALLRAAMGEHLGEPAWERLLARYRAASPEFDALWQQRREVRGWKTSSSASTTRRRANCTCSRSTGGRHRATAIGWWCTCLPTRRRGPRCCNCMRNRPGLPRRPTATERRCAVRDQGAGTAQMAGACRVAADRPAPVPPITSKGRCGQEKEGRNVMRAYPFRES